MQQKVKNPLCSECADRRHVGFTLIELLVGIASIAILTTMLLPVLSSAKRISCLSNQLSS